MDKTQSSSFVGACMDFFGKKPGQTLTEFGAEIKALTEKDRAEIKAGLIQNGYNIRD